MFFCDCLCISRNFLAVFYLNSSFSFTWLTFLDNISLSSFKIWIFSNYDVVSFFAFVLELTISLRTIFYNFVLWFSSFFLNFKLACFLIESSCIFYRSIGAFFDNFFFTSLKLWVVSVFSVVSKFSFLNNWFNTNSYNSVFFFCNLFYFFSRFTLTVGNFCSNSYFFFAWLTFVFNFLESSVFCIIIDNLGFIRNFSFNNFFSFSLNFPSTYTNNVFCWFFSYFFANLLSFTIWLTILNSLFITCCFRTSFSFLINNLFALLKSWVFLDFNFKWYWTSLLVFVLTCEVLCSYDYFLFSFSYNFFSCLFNLSSFWIVLVNDFCFNFTWSEFTSFNYSLVLCIIVNIFNFNFDFFRIVVFWSFNFCSNFDDVLLSFNFVRFFFSHFSIS